MKSKAAVGVTARGGLKLLIFSRLLEFKRLSVDRHSIVLRCNCLDAESLFHSVNQRYRAFVSGVRVPRAGCARILEVRRKTVD
jgi:hypothetical protein